MTTSTPFYLNRNKESLPDNFTTSLFKQCESTTFHQTLEAYSPTPVIELKELANEYEVGKIFLKDESFRFGLNAFKGLGASYAIHKILEQDSGIQTFCTATDGNHGRAVAWAAALHGRTSRIFVPKDTTASRIEAIRQVGAIVEKINGNYEETSSYAKRMSEENYWTLVQDAAWNGYEEIPAYIKAGYFTQFTELERDLHSLPNPAIDVVFLQSGVGSWPAAAAWYYRNRYGNKKPQLIVVEPTESAGLLASFQKGKRSSPDGNYTTMMAGLNCGIPSSTAWEILKVAVDASIAVEDHFMETAIRKLYYPQGEDSRVISGESGAGGVAGFIALMTDPRFKDLKQELNINSNSRILFYSTEGNTDPENFNKIISCS